MDQQVTTIFIVLAGLVAGNWIHMIIEFHTLKGEFKVIKRLVLNHIREEHGGEHIGYKSE